MKKLIIGMSVLAATVATPAMAAVDVWTDGAATAQSFAAPADATTVMNFNDSRGTAFEASDKGLTAAFAGNARRVEDTTNSDLTMGELFLRPEPSDNTGFFGVGRDGSLTLTSKTGFGKISFFGGSLDSYNVVDLLDANGNSIANYDGTQMLGFKPPFPGTTDSNTNRRINFAGTDGTQFFGIKFSNKDNLGSFEFDNVAFTAAVPEPGTWMTMILGFGVIGSAMRRRRSNTVAHQLV